MDAAFLSGSSSWHWHLSNMTDRTQDTTRAALSRRVTATTVNNQHINTDSVYSWAESVCVVGRRWGGVGGSPNHPLTTPRRARNNVPTAITSCLPPFPPTITNPYYPRDKRSIETVLQARWAHYCSLHCTVSINATTIASVLGVSSLEKCTPLSNGFTWLDNTAVVGYNTTYLTKIVNYPRV